MCPADRFTYEEGDLIVKESYCDFCRFSIEGDAARCTVYPDGKPEEITSVAKICTEFSMKED